MTILLKGYMKYRSRTDIIGQILEAANGGTTKTRIMYTAYLSYAQLKEYLSILVENDLLEYQEGENKYIRTEKGLKYKKMYDQMSTMTGNMTEISL
jgi:predicted transcriptional regulator